MYQNKFEYFLLEMHDIIINNPKMHYNIDCDATNRTVFTMSSQWMIQ